MRHRRSMFADMGNRERVDLDAMDASSRPLFARALGEGSYRGWLAQEHDGRVVAGGGIILLPAKKTMIDRTALRLEPVALIMIVKTAGPRMPANFSNTEKKAKNSDDLCRGTRVEKTDRLSAWLPPCTVPTSSASTKKSRAVVIR